MSARRSLSWTAALRDMRADRIGLEERRAIMAAQHTAKIEAMRAACGTRNGLWTPAAGFDRRAIMAFAVQHARAVLNGTMARGCWRTAMAHGLTSAWQAAHAARRSASH